MMSIEQDDFEEQYMSPLYDEWQLIEDYNDQFSVSGILASILLGHLKNREEEGMGTALAEQKFAQNIERLEKLQNSEFLHQIGLSVSSEADGGVLIGKSGTLQMQKIHFNVADPTKLKKFFSSMAEANYKVVDEQLKEIFAYIFGSLSWQVIHTYNFGPDGVDDTFLNFIQIAEHMVTSAQQVGLGGATQGVAQILNYSRRQCLNEYIAYRNLRLFPDQTGGWLYPPSIGWDAPIDRFIGARKEVFAQIELAQQNPYAYEMTQELLIFWHQKISVLYDSLPDQSVVPEYVRENFSVYKDAIDEVKHTIEEYI